MPLSFGVEMVPIKQQLQVCLFFNLLLFFVLWRGQARNPDRKHGEVLLPWSDIGPLIFVFF